MEQSEREKAIDYLKSWAASSVRPTRNGEQVRKYVAKADDDDLLVACAYVRRHKGFPHEQHFHLAVEKVDVDDLEQVKRFLGEDEDQFLLELGLEEEKGLPRESNPHGQDITVHTLN